MRRGSGRGRAAPAPVVWSRHKLLALFAGGALVLLLLSVGLVLAVLEAVRPAERARAGPPAAGPASAAPAAPAAPGSAPQASDGSTGLARDALAAAPMPTAPESAARPSAVSLVDPGRPIALPPATRIGPAGVPTGFPRTPEGALAQLAAIDATALSSGSLVGVREVIAGWAVPGGPTTSSWSGVRAMAGLLNAAGVSGGGSGQLAVVATPLMGLVKGTVGPAFVVPCVDFEVDVTLTSTARGAVADCQRMVWTGGRWIIGAGSEPAEAPSVWPGTDLAVQVGYRDLRHG